MRTQLAIKAHALIEKHFPERRLFLKSDTDTRFIRLKPETCGVVTSADLALMKSTSLLVNTSRAGLIEDGFRDRILAGPMRSFTPQTKQDPAALRAELDAIRSAGFAECVEEIEVGVSSVAAPIRVGALGATFSLGATGPIRRFSKTRRAEIGAALMEMAGQVSTALQVQQASAG